MGKYNSINDAVRAKIDELVEEKGLDKKDYLYTADVASSLNQLANIMGGSGDSMTIADSLYDVLDSATGSGSPRDEENEDAIIEQTITSLYNSTVTKIGDFAFCGCSTLTSIDCPNVTSIGSFAFAPYWSGMIPIGAKLENAAFPNCITIADKAFENNGSLSTINIENTRSIGRRAFAKCSSLTSIDLPNCTTVGQEAFISCFSLTSISLPNCVTIHTSAFNDTNISVLSLPKVTSMGYDFPANLEKLYLPELSTGNTGDTSYFTFTVSNKQSLRAVYLSKQRAFTSNAFGSCHRLLSLYLLGSNMTGFAASNPNVNNAFMSTPMIGYTQYTDGQYGSIYVRASLLTSYKTDSTWKSISERFVGLTDTQIEQLEF